MWGEAGKTEKKGLKGQVSGCVKGRKGRYERRKKARCSGEEKK